MDDIIRDRDTIKRGQYCQSNGDMDTAVYDPKAKAVRLPPSGADQCGSFIDGTVIEMDDLGFPPGCLLCGEVVEIVVMDSNMVPLAVHGEGENIGRTITAGVLSREQVAERQRQQTLLHYEETQALAEKHQYEKQNIAGLKGRLSPESLDPLVSEMEFAHKRELDELQTRHARDQSEMIDLVFESASISAASISAASSTSEGSRLHENSYTPDASHDDEGRRQNLWGKTAVAAVAAKNLATFSLDEDPKELRRQPTLAQRESIDVQACIDAPTSSVAQAQTTRDNRRREIQSVLSDSSIPREEKQKKLAEIKAKYSTQTPTSENSTSGSAWNKAAVGAIAANTIARQRLVFPAKASEDTRSIADLINQLKSNDPNLTVINLDGFESANTGKWMQMFETLEYNSHLTSLSVANCRLEDDDAVALVLALVENETLKTINLGQNLGLTDGTGRALVKVLKQSNVVVKKIDLDGTSISEPIQSKLQTLLDQRDDTKKLERLQQARQKKIQELLSFSASERFALAVPEDNMDGGSISVGSSVGTANEIEKKKDRKRMKNESTASLASSGGNKSSASGNKKSTAAKKNWKAVVNASAIAQGTRHKSSNCASSQNSGSAASGGNKKNAVAASAKPTSAATKASAVAREMAMLGGDVASGKTKEEVIEGRRLRGECLSCGQRCYQKTLFKTVPLNIPSKVKEGVCLNCSV